MKFLVFKIILLCVVLCAVGCVWNLLYRLKVLISYSGREIGLIIVCSTDVVIDSLRFSYSMGRERCMEFTNVVSSQ